MKKIAAALPKHMGKMLLAVVVVVIAYFLFLKPYRISMDMDTCVKGSTDLSYSIVCQSFAGFSVDPRPAACLYMKVDGRWELMKTTTGSIPDESQPVHGFSREKFFYPVGFPLESGLYRFEVYNYMETDKITTQFEVK